MSHSLSFQLIQRYCVYLKERLQHDRIHVNAGYLAYMTLLSLVPMLAVCLSILSSFSLFDGIGEKLQAFVFTHFVPTAGEAINRALGNFVANANQMTWLGGIFLLVIVFTLISNIDKTLNYIWRIQVKRRWVFSFSMYWMILTLGPLLLGTSIAATSYIASLRLIHIQIVSNASELLIRWLPFLLSYVVFMGLYVFVPNKKVQVKYASLGALVAAILFECSKQALATYLVAFPSYQLIYGALAAIPILFIWVYLSWLIVLLGAEVTASLEENQHWQD